MIGFHNTFPFGDLDISINGSEYLGVQDIVRMMRVCGGWRDWASENLVVWKNASQHDKIPIVDGKDRNYRDDLKQIRPLVSSIHGLFGRVLGPVPPISEETFRKFTTNDPDPFGEGNFRDNFMLFIDPSYIERQVDKDTPLALRGNSLAKVSPAKVKELMLTDINITWRLAASSLAAVSRSIAATSASASLTAWLCLAVLRKF